MYQEISLLVEKMQLIRNEPVLLVGDFMLDEYLLGDTDRISPEAPVPILKVTSRQKRLGGAGSVGASLVALGAKTWCAGVVGADLAGLLIQKMLRDLGADVSALLAVPEISTTVKQRMIGLAQHRNRQQLLRVDMEDSADYPHELIEKIQAQILPLLDRVKLIAVEDYNKGLFCSGEMLRWLVAEAKKRNLPVVVDPARITDYSRYTGVDVITPNRVETAHAAAMPIASIDDARAAGSLLHEKFNIKNVIVKLDRDGILIADGSTKHIPTQPREVFDNTGAGDVVLATIALALAEGLSLENAAALANVAGGWEVQQPGVVPITRQQLIYELLAQSRRHTGKLVERSQLLRELEILRAAGKKIVFTNGCFDLLHPGHVSYLEFAREQGDVLVVGMNSDKSVQSIKGPKRPLINEMDRARMLASLEAVDYVVIFDESSVIGLVEQVRPEILVKGQDYNVQGVVGHEFVQSYGGKIALAPIEHQYSTSKIIQTILDRCKD
jgi:D-beta-D-heptose 7-phosphate kinase/D-beta-D-heptose 1-phosphate adenosyltransferase